VRRVRCFCAALLFLAVLPPEETRRLASGEVLVSLAPAPGGGPQEATGRGVIDAPPERVFRALSDYAHWQEFMPFLEKSDLLPGRGGAAESLHVLKLPAPFGERRYRVRFSQQEETGPKGTLWRIDWSYVPGSGNLAGHRGSWTLTAFGPGRTLAVCRLLTDPGGGVPQWMMDRANRKNLPWIFDGLRQHVRRSRYDGQ
jgi:polyketide cyclase/dehydrase/lipid transport protein